MTHTQAPMVGRRVARRFLAPGVRAALLAVVVLALLAWSVQDAPLLDILKTLRRLEVWQIVVLLLLNLLVLLSMSVRWWLIVRAENARVPLLAVVAYRLSGFAVSYLTPGPQVGGEPLQVILLRNRHEIPVARATATVVLDKLLEFLGNFVLIGAGVIAALQLGVMGIATRQLAILWPALIGLVLVPPIYMLLLRLNRRPVRSLLRLALPSFAGRKWFRLIAAAEFLSSSLLRRHPRPLMAAFLVSLASWLGMATEYFLTLRFLEIDLAILPAFVSLTTAMLSFLLPLPAGLGALEAGQVLALGSFGHPPAAAVGLSLLLRGRDLINAALGLALLRRGLRRPA